MFSGVKIAQTPALRLWLEFTLHIGFTGCTYCGRQTRPSYGPRAVERTASVFTTDSTPSSAPCRPGAVLMMLPADGMAAPLTVNVPATLRAVSVTGDGCRAGGSAR